MEGIQGAHASEQPPGFSAGVGGASDGRPSGGSGSQKALVGPASRFYGLPRGPRRRGGAPKMGWAQRERSSSRRGELAGGPTWAEGSVALSVTRIVACVLS